MRWTNPVGGPPISIITLSDQLTDQFFNTSEDGKMDQLTEVRNLMTLFKGAYTLAPPKVTEIVVRVAFSVHTVYSLGTCKYLYILTSTKVSPPMH